MQRCSCFCGRFFSFLFSPSRAELRPVCRIACVCVGGNGRRVHGGQGDSNSVSGQTWTWLPPSKNTSLGHTWPLPPLPSKKGSYQSFRGSRLSTNSSNQSLLAPTSSSQTNSSSSIVNMTRNSSLRSSVTPLSRLLSSSADIGICMPLLLKYRHRPKKKKPRTEREIVFSFRFLLVLEILHTCITHLLLVSCRSSNSSINSKNKLVLVITNKKLVACHNNRNSNAPQNSSN